MIKMNQLDEQVVLLLQRVYTIYPTDYSLEEWCEMCDQGEGFLFTQHLNDKVVYAGIVEVYDDCLNARFGAGKDLQWNFEEVYNFLLGATKRLGKEKLCLTGRKGWWKKYLKNLDFKLVDEIKPDTGRPFFIYEKII